MNQEFTNNNYDAYTEQSFMKIKEIWSKGPTSQEEIINEFLLIRSPELENTIYDFVQDRFANASEEEKVNIIKACGALGGTSLEVEQKSTEFLSNYAKTVNVFNGEIARGLETKIMRSSASLKKTDESTDDLIKNQHQDIISKSTEALVGIISSNNSTDCKVKAISGIFRAGILPETREKIINALEDAERSDDSVVNLAAFYELAMLILNTNQFDEILSKRITEFSEWSDRSACINMAIIIGRSKNPKYCGFVKKLGENGLFLTDKEYCDTVRWARDEIGSEGVDEK